MKRKNAALTPRKIHENCLPIRLFPLLQYSRRPAAAIDAGPVPA